MAPYPPTEIVFDPHVLWAIGLIGAALILVMLCLVPPDKR